VASEIKRHGLISQLFVTYAGAILVLGKQKPGKQVVGSMVARSSRGDEAFHGSTRRFGMSAH
jgi:hypothetical protein